MAIKTIDDTHLKQIANAIREKTGSAEGISVDEMPEQIKGIKGGATLPELENEGLASDLLSGKQLISQNGEVVTGTIATKTASNLTASGATVTVPAGYYATQATKSVATATQATPSITVSSAGLITASATQSAGYVAAGTKSGTKQLTVQAAKTVTPTKSSQTAVASGRYTTGAITVAAIPAQYITTTDATATAADMRVGKTAYVNGAKVTGSIADFDGSYECSGESTGGGGGASIETIKFTYTGGNAEQYPVYIGYTTVDAYGTLTAAEQNVSTGIASVIITCACNSIVFVQTKSTISTDGTSRNCELLRSVGSTGLVIKINSPTAGIISGDTAEYTTGVGNFDGGTND